MTTIINAIDEYTNELFASLKVKTWGFCELAYKTAKDSKGNLIGASGSQPIVLQIPDNPVPNGDRGKAVSLDDKYDFITWIRWVEPVRFDFSQAWSFGREEAEQGTVTLRIVVAHKAILGEILIFQFTRGLPRKMDLSGYKYIFMDGRPQINPDHESIYNTELGNTAYEKHRFTWNIYVVDVTFNFLECVLTTP
jgi:hypothetical protein